MGKNKYPYWNYVKHIIREYPELKRKIDTPLEPRTGSPLGGNGGSGKISNPTLDCVVHSLPRPQQRKYDAIEQAIAMTYKLHPADAHDRLLIVDLVYWKQTHTIEGAAMRVPCHRNTACGWQAEFIRLVANQLELV